jgi:hypothetical protein
MQENLAPVLFSLKSVDPARPDEAVNKTHRTVRSDSHPSGQIPDGCALLLTGPDRQEGLMLLDRESGTTRCRFTECQETTDLVPEMGQQPVIRCFKDR